MRSRTCCALFEDETVPHEKGTVDPMRDLENVETELILSDLMVVEKRLERLDKDRKKVKNPELDHEFELLEKCKAHARAGQAAARACRSTPKRRSGFGASSSFRRSRCCTC